MEDGHMQQYWEREYNLKHDKAHENWRAHTCLLLAVNLRQYLRGTEEKGTVDIIKVVFYIRER